MEKKTKPDHIRVGAIRLTIWRDVRKNNEGHEFTSTSVTLDRAYKDAKGDWQNTSSIRDNDIPKAILALCQGYAQIMSKAADESNGND